MGFPCTNLPLPGTSTAVPVLAPSPRRTPSVAIGSSAGGRRAHGSRGRSVMRPALPSRGRGRNSGSYTGARPAQATDHVGGIGIAEFLEGKNFLITGGTGFLAKVLIEKILRTNSDVGKIYVLMKAKDAEAALKRLQTDVVDAELFKCLQEIHGKDFHSFIARKLVPVAGDIREANLGITQEFAHKIQDEVDVIVNSAGNTTFHERYDVAMDINTLGSFRVMNFAQRFRRLKLFLHVSTAYVNGQRQGVVLEKPFRMGDSIANEILLSSADSLEHTNCAALDIEAEIKLAFDPIRKSDDSASCTQEMKDLGLKRAKCHGWQDTYVFTKAMGEMVINNMRGEIPVVIIRPSVVESTLRDPFPGWIQGNRMVDPIIIYYGKGQMCSFLGDPDCVFDVVPADIVVSVTLASMAKHARVAAPGMHVYQVASSTVNPLPFRDLFQFFFHHFSGSPLVDAAGRPIPVRPMRFCGSMEQYAGNVETTTAWRAASRGLQSPSASADRLSRRRQARDLRVAQIMHLGRIYEPYTFYGGRFDTANTEALLAEMSEEERASFFSDVRSVDWEDYFVNVHVPGVRKHVIKGRGSPKTIRCSPAALPSQPRPSYR